FDHPPRGVVDHASQALNSRSGANKKGGHWPPRKNCHCWRSENVARVAVPAQRLARQALLGERLVVEHQQRAVDVTACLPRARLDHGVKRTAEEAAPCIRSHRRLSLSVWEIAPP